MGQEGAQRQGSPVPGHAGSALMFNDLSRLGKYLGQAARLMVGMPDYDNYVEHMHKTHPDQPVMSYEVFFRERQDARYGGKAGPKCC
jgi:uncharacterized short protein YbdD (DUF466 family)